MPVEVTCPSCDAEYKVPESLLGKKIRCKACQGAIPVRDPAGEEGDEPEVDAPVRRKKKRKAKKSQTGAVKILCAVAALFFAFLYLGLKLMRMNNADRPNIAANRPVFPNMMPAPFPNREAEVTDPDQMIHDKFPEGKNRFTIDSPQKIGNRLEFDYTMLDPPADNGVFNNPNRPIVLNESVSVVVAAGGRIADSQLISIIWQEKGRIQFQSLFGSLPSGMRVCLAIKNQRVSNVIVVP